MKRILITLGLALLTSPAWATHTSGNASAEQASMDVNGSITVSPRGNVIGYKLDQPGKLPAFVVNMLNQAIPKWQFYPNLHNGHAFIVKASMDIRLVAKPLANGKYSISIDQTTFGNGHEKDDYQIRYKGKLTPPLYPPEAGFYHASGTAFVVLLINRRGLVAKAAVAEVDLETRGPPNLMVRWRREFAESALKAARKWQFLVPTEGIFASRDHWVVEIPVDFRIRGSHGAKYAYAYGKWRAYLPGPSQDIKWAPSLDSSTAKPPAGDNLQIAGSGLQRIHKPKS